MILLQLAEIFCRDHHREKVVAKLCQGLLFAVEKGNRCGKSGIKFVPSCALCDMEQTQQQQQQYQGQATAPAAGGNRKSVLGPNEKMCEYYLQPRGCVKGDKCDFVHLLAPNGAQTTRICQYFMTPNGCVKGDACDFLHPKSSKPQVDRPCQYFMTPRGCVKGILCEFKHAAPAGGVGRGPSVGSMSGWEGGYGEGGYGGYPAPRGPAAGAGARSAAKPCTYFMTPRGCIKGDNCDFSHGPAPGRQSGPGPYGEVSGYPPAAGGYGGYDQSGHGAAGYGYPQGGYGAPMGGPPGPRGPAPPGMHHSVMGKKPKPCEFFMSERGCVKGDACDFIHRKSKPCSYFTQPRGCAKGEYCDFMHDGAAGEASTGTGGGKAPSSHESGVRYKPY
eukprot:g62656.t1